MITTWVGITPDSVLIGGKNIDHRTTGNALLTELYRERVNDYPKFFKMDTLCKLGFIASEMLLAYETGGMRQFTPREDRAIVLFNRNGSLNTDHHFQQTIRNRENYFPSPSIFAYTLPNIVTGEIAIRNNYYGETSFYVLVRPDAEIMTQHIGNTFQDAGITSVLAGWVDCESEDNFQALLFLVDKRQTSNILVEEINSFYNQLNI
jgi:3-oxoacyl-[acyl-carrier-protein] synthase-1